MNQIEKRIVLDSTSVADSTGFDMPSACDLIITKETMTEILAVSQVMKHGTYNVNACGFTGYDDDGQEISEYEWKPEGIQLVLRSYNVKASGELTLTAKVFNRYSGEEYLFSNPDIVLTRAEIDELLTDEDEEGEFTVWVETTIVREPRTVRGKRSEIKANHSLISEMCNDKETGCDTSIFVERI